MSALPEISARQTLRQEIVDAFGLDELETLCRDLGIDPDRIPGKDQGKDYWVDQIITYFERRERMPDLLSALRRERPGVAWAYPLVVASAATLTTSATSATPRRLPIAALVGLGALALVLITAVAIALRPPNTSSPPVTTPAATPAFSSGTGASATAEIASSSPQSTTPRAPQRMSPLNYNIFVADFGELQAGRAISLPEGRAFSESFVQSLKIELDDLSTVVRSDLQPQVWGNREAEQNGWQIGATATISDAQQIGDRLGAQLVIYGNMALSDTVGKLDVGYYIPQAVNTADELAGAYSLGPSVSTNWPPSNDTLLAMKVTLNKRQRLISRLAIGLAYDLLGRQKDALKIFQAAVEELNPECRAGREVLYFLVGREYLLLNQSAEAEQAHKTAYDCDNRYTRALIGLGDVSFQYAAAITPEARLGSDALQAANDYYGRAEQSALTMPGMPQLVTLARLGLGLTTQLEGATYYELGQDDEAKSSLTGAIRLIEPALNELSRRPDGQKRTLAIGYSRLAEAYWYSAILTSEHDENTSKNYYALAEGNFNKCVALVPPGSDSLDPMLTDVLAAACRDNLEKMQATRPR